MARQVDLARSTGLVGAAARLMPCLPRCQSLQHLGEIALIKHRGNERKFQKQHGQMFIKRNSNYRILTLCQALFQEH